MNQESSLHILLIDGANGTSGNLAPLRTMLKTTSATHELANIDTLEGSVLRMESGTFDAVLLHLVQPDADSLKVILHLRERAPEVPVLVVSDLNNEETALSAVQAGAQDYLIANTYDAHQLLRAIRYAIERNHMQVTLRVLSLLDDLTGVYNRRGFMTLAEHQIRVSQRNNIGFHLIFIDLDGMKQINDTGGHIAGDQALIAIAQVLSYTFRGSDVVARMGGDEFAVITCGTESQSLDNADNIIARLESAVTRHNKRHLDEPALSISYGAIFFDPAENKTLDQMLLEADQLMYENKRRKKQLQLADFNLQTSIVGTQSGFTDSTLFNIGIP
jgi:diguanylate cyclase (GGDEF)-like protein